MDILTYTYIDNSNFFIEGQRAAAVESGMALDIYDALERGVFNHSWQPDYGRLHALVCGDKKQIGAAKLWGSPPPSDTFWQMVERKGFKVRTYERSHGKEKKVDVAIGYEIAKDVHTIDKAASEITLVAGDKDFVPVVEDLVLEGYQVCVAFWDHAAKEMKEKATTFFSLNQYLQHLSRFPKHLTS
jgi:uncharacterized LabA/DUF88 family protein